jgi:HAD superfamily hydrolase (TIGR01509 family)
LLQTAGGKERIRAFDRSRQSPSLLSDQDVIELHRIKTRRYADLIANGDCPLRPGVEALLKSACRRGQRLAIATTTSPGNIDALLSAATGKDWADRFDAIVAGDQVARKKPAPDVYLEVLGRLAIPASDCIAIEDSTTALSLLRWPALRWWSPAASISMTRIFRMPCSSSMISTRYWAKPLDRSGTGFWERVPARHAFASTRSRITGHVKKSKKIDSSGGCIGFAACRNWRSTYHCVRVYPRTPHEVWGLLGCRRTRTVSALAVLAGAAAAGCCDRRGRAFAQLVLPQAPEPKSVTLRRKRHAQFPDWHSVAG